MADKKPAADNWPVVSGDYIVGELLLEQLLLDLVRLKT